MSGRLLTKQAAGVRARSKRRSARGQAVVKRVLSGPRLVKSPVRNAVSRRIAVRDDAARQELRELLDHVAALERFSVAQFRERYDVSRERLSIAAQLPYQTILRWEKSTSVPRLSSFRAFAEALLAG